jgi:hypothetical protein
MVLICDDQLFVKITPAGKAVVGDRYAEGIAYPGAKPSMLVSASDWKTMNSFRAHPGHNRGVAATKAQGAEETEAEANQTSVKSGR